MHIARLSTLRFGLGGSRGEMLPRRESLRTLSGLSSWIFAALPLPWLALATHLGFFGSSLALARLPFVLKAIAGMFSAWPTNKEAHDKEPEEHPPDGFFCQPYPWRDTDN